MAGRGSIRKLSQDRWRIEVPLGKDVSGKRKRYTYVFHGKKRDAEEYLAERVRRRNLGLPLVDAPEPVRETLNAFLDRWLSGVVRVRTDRRSTADSYATVLRLYIRGSLGEEPLSAVTASRIQDIYNAMLERKLAAKTVRYVNTVLGSALEQAVKWKLLAENPCEDVVLPKLPRREKKQLGDPADAARLLKALQASPYGPMLIIALLSGMRPSEYQALKPEDVQWATGAIKVHRSIEWFRDGTWAWADNKNKSSQRTVMMPPLVIEMLREQLVRNKSVKERAGVMWQEHGLLFPGPDGQPVKRRVLADTHLRKALEAAGLPRMTLYSLRHWQNTLLFMLGVPAEARADRLGHASTKMTMDVYTHVQRPMEEAIAAKLQDVFGAQPDATTDD